MTHDFHTRSVEETEALGARLGALLMGGEFVGLEGDLGAGKTAFVRGVARGLGVPADSQVSSPTFAIVNTYHGGRIALFHADLYRIRDAEELYDAGFYDLFGDTSALVVEWIDRVPEFAPADALSLVIRKQGSVRTISATAQGAVSVALLEAWAKGSG